MPDRPAAWPEPRRAAVPGRGHRLVPAAKAPDTVPHPQSYQVDTCGEPKAPVPAWRRDPRSADLCPTPDLLHHPKGPRPAGPGQKAHPVPGRSLPTESGALQIPLLRASWRFHHRNPASVGHMARPTPKVARPPASLQDLRPTHRAGPGSPKHRASGRVTRNRGVTAQRVDVHVVSMMYAQLSRSHPKQRRCRPTNCRARPSLDPTSPLTLLLPFHISTRTIQDRASPWLF